MSDIMTDLETYGQRPGCVIRSIGAVVFNLNGSVGAQFYANIEHSSCIEAGLTVDPDTQAWWGRQAKEAQTALLVNPKPLKKVLKDFTDWFFKNSGTRIWSQGANFDEPILIAALHAVGIKVPWKFWNARDTRTLYDLADFDTRTVTRAGTYHNALDDAKYQVRCCQLAYAKLKSTKLEVPPVTVPAVQQVGGFLDKHVITTGKVMPWE